MAKQKTVVPFKGTPDQEMALNKVIEQYKDTEGSLMPVLQKAQEIYGYLPIEVQTMIAKGLNLPIEQVYQVVTFYAQFTLNPVGKYKISVCLGTACYVKGSGKIIDAIQTRLGLEPGATSPDGKVSLEATRCVGACGLAPVMTVNGTVYGRITEKDVDGILDKYLA